MNVFLCFGEHIFTRDLAFPYSWLLSVEVRLWQSATYLRTAERTWGVVCLLRDAHLNSFTHTPRRMTVSNYLEDLTESTGRATSNIHK